MKEMKLISGEEKVFELEADFWNRGSNPIQKIIGNFFRIINLILGNKIHGKLIITNLRAFEIKETVRLFCIPTNRELKLLTKNSIKEIGYTMEKTCLFFCPNYTLYYDAHTQSTSIAVLNGTEDKMLDLLDKFYNVIK
ncbi:hypothetical protein [Leptospira interrogans]|uniref:Uncharacterized protein n=3 Tax=Leptospira interrogans TaxID=173 RepID=A0A0E2DHL7_LEPIR|nr:hypothetical protein [Leptospira interrogans]EKR55131.1 hypothetical protein LEP1GSC105_2547 [Leptospira interrogans str. UI 12758]QOI51581.1 hypothetical protein Lepto1489_14805 [Leptospira interrogans serovar Bataviae]WOT10899.1 hypothetical protein CFY92_0018250 [Leptospira interrogans]